MKSIVRYLVAVVVLVWIAGASTSASAGGWPREIRGLDGTRVKLYQPQIDSWDYYVTLRFQMAAEFVLPGHDEPVPAALRMEASTSTDLQKRTVTVFNVKVIDIKFPSADEATARRLTEAMTSHVSRKTHSLGLDDVLAYFEPAAQRPRPEPPAAPVANLERPDELIGQTPAIVVSQTPAVLVLFDGEPLYVEIDATELEFAVNTNWDVFHDPASSTYYLLHDDAWLKAPATTGPWAPADRLPKAFSQLPESDSFKEVRRHVPGKKISKEDTPRVFVSYRPTDLILLDGEAVEEKIPGTDLVWISNTESDLFRSKASGDYYYLVSGRWFRASNLKGPWSHASSELPESFAAIPTDHPAARVRVSVPGTPEAEEAVMLASIPQKAEVKRNEVTVVVRYDGDPEFRAIEGTTVFYAANTAFDVFRVGSLYYACFQGVWFVATSPQGPWTVCDEVPGTIYTIPPTNPKYHVTFVYVYDSTPDVVVVGYTAGYTGVYVSYGCVVYGTGWYYPPYVYDPPYGYPVYRAYPHSYGVAASYNPYTGTYARGAAVYGPYGGAGWGAAYNPATGTYARGAAVYGPYGSAARGAAYNPTTGTYARGATASGAYGSAAVGQAYNPRTDTYGASYQRSNPYASWGESVVTRGDEWVHTGYYSDSRGTVAGAETSQGGRAGAVQTDQGTAYAGKDKDNNLYAGKDGNVYKRSDDGWSTYNDGEWQSVERSAGSTEQRQEAQGRAEQAGAERSTRTAEGSSGTLDGLEKDRQARSRSSQRSQERESWGSDRSKPESGSSSRGSRSQGGGRRR